MPPQSSLPPELLALLRCPESGQTLSIAPTETVAAIEAARAAGTLRTRDGEPVSARVTHGLVRADGQLFFQTREGIPILLLHEAVSLPLSTQDLNVRSERPENSPVL